MTRTDSEPEICTFSLFRFFRVPGGSRAGGGPRPPIWTPKSTPISTPISTPKSGVRKDPSGAHIQAQRSPVGQSRLPSGPVGPPSATTYHRRSSDSARVIPFSSRSSDNFYRRQLLCRASYKVHRLTSSDNFYRITFLAKRIYKSQLPSLTST